MNPTTFQPTHRLIGAYANAYYSYNCQVMSTSTSGGQLKWSALWMRVNFINPADNVQLASNLKGNLGDFWNQVATQPYPDGLAGPAGSRAPCGFFGMSWSTWSGVTGLDPTLPYSPLDTTGPEQNPAGAVAFLATASGICSMSDLSVGIIQGITSSGMDCTNVFGALIFQVSFAMQSDSMVFYNSLTSPSGIAFWVFNAGAGLPCGAVIGFVSYANNHCWCMVVNGLNPSAVLTDGCGKISPIPVISPRRVADKVFLNLASTQWESVTATLLNAQLANTVRAAHLMCNSAVYFQTIAGVNTVVPISASTDPRHPIIIIIIIITITITIIIIL
ncbi:hypothetical protein FOA52_005872 [Chlamydomonas sp. UWO 241]|nr:hypothetical protein FOA52_005872 [Chlamydomonas sp. UWO 241]